MIKLKKTTIWKAMTCTVPTLKKLKVWKYADRKKWIKNYTYINNYSSVRWSESHISFIFFRSSSSVTIVNKIFNIFVLLYFWKTLSFWETLVFWLLTSFFKFSTRDTKDYNKWKTLLVHSKLNYDMPCGPLCICCCMRDTYVL